LAENLFGFPSVPRSEQSQTEGSSLRLSAPRIAISAAVIGTAAATASVAFAAAGPDKTATASKASAPSSSDVVVHTVNDVSASSTLQYWTAKRMRAAKPVPVPKTVNNAATAAAAVDPADAAVAPGGVAPAPVGATAAASGGISSAAVIKAKQWPASKRNSGIAKTTGRVFFKRNGQDYVCSASVVNAPNKRSVWTAGHCLHSGGPKGKWHTNVMFVPGYRDGKAPRGKYTALKLVVAKQWVNSKNVNRRYGYDLAAFTVRNWKGKRIQARTGAQGINWGYKKRTYSMRLFGYPMVFLPSGKPTQRHRMYYCTGKTVGVRFHSNAPIGLGIKCTMGGGASGGPWIYGMNSKGWGRIVGVNSTHSTVNTYMYSPYHGKAAASVYKTVRKL